jgi:O-antigen/teichoic acid export membrane protein
MRKFDRLQILKNVSSSWLSLGVNVAAGIFLSPFILHRLGDVAFGIWVLIFSLTGYYGLFDLGIRSSIVRYVSKFSATNDKEDLARLINTSLFGYTCVGVLSMLITLAGYFYVDRVFRIPEEFQSTARWLLLMVGTSVAVGFPLGIVSGFLEGLQKFYVLNWTNIAFTLLRAALIVLFLDRGYGLLTVAFITVSLPLFSSIVRGAIALRILPVPFGFRYIDRATFRQVAKYSSVTFTIMIAGRLKFKTDEIVIGTMLSAAAITYFNIGARIVDYAGEVVTSLAQIFVPMASQSEATGDMHRLRKIFIVGNRVCAFAILPICAILIILGKSVIEVWVGSRYVAASYPVLVVMIIPWTLMLSQGASGRILFGMGQHGTWAKVTLIEGVVNLILSVLLVRPFGIVGDALGTAIPLTCSMVLFMPQHLCSKLGFRVTSFLRQAYFLPLIICIPMVAVLLLMHRWFVPHTYAQLGMQLLVALLIYGLCLLWASSTNRALQVEHLPSVPEQDVSEALSTVTETLRQDL